MAASVPSGGGGGESEFINLQTEIIRGYGEYSQEQVDELLQYLKETYGNGTHSGEITGFKYTFNGYHITHFTYRYISDIQVSFVGMIGTIGEVYFEKGYNYIMIY